MTPLTGHKVATLTKGSEHETYSYDNGALRTQGSRFTYAFDPKGRLRSVTEKLNGAVQSSLTRVVYSYSGFDRLIGRRVEVAPISNGQAPQDADWHLATADLSVGALPPATTFVWDPVSDQLVAVYEEGTGKILRQYIHGGLGLDDPIEVTMLDATVADGVRRVYPIYDEAGAGSLQAVLGESGELLTRSIATDPYGEDQLSIGAPAVEKVTISAKKDDNGAVTQVDLSVRLTPRGAANQ